MESHEVQRQLAVERYRSGESVEAICASTKKSRSWLYKWIKRAEAVGDDCRDASRRPATGGIYEASERELIVAIRKRLEEEGNFTSAEMIAWEMRDEGVRVPSVATIKRVIKSAGLTRTAKRVPKGTRYPAPMAVDPGAVHQADFVGPRHSSGVRFYSLNTVDLVTARAATEPIASRGTTDVVPALWSTWMRLGIPRILQFDNELVFFGNRRAPHAMGQVLRMCFEHDVEPLFIPMREPWRNSVVEKFNDHWDKKLYRRMKANTFAAVQAESIAFEERHNRTWRYSKLGGHTPNAVLKASGTELRLPPQSTPPAMPYRKPERGIVRLIRFIRSDGLLDVFGERFKLPSEASYEYVTATVDIAARVLTVTLHDQILERFDYPIP